MDNEERLSGAWKDLSLRDYFASQCLGVIPGIWEAADKRGDQVHISAENIAKLAYSLADAMLTERTQC